MKCECGPSVLSLSLLTQVHDDKEEEAFPYLTSATRALEQDLKVSPALAALSPYSSFLVTV